jgi:hypothetical protein
MKTLFPKTLSPLHAQPRVQVLPSSKGEIILVSPLSPPHPTTTLIFLTDLRSENLTAYLEALACHRFGEASFLEGGLSGIDAVLNHPPETYPNFQRESENHLQNALRTKDWAAANWWKGYVCGLELARHVQKIAWYKPVRDGDRLLDWFNRTRGAFV